MPTAERYRFRALQEARAAVLGQPVRSAVAMAGLGVAVALFLAVQSLVVTVRFQVADSFDAYEATTVHAALDTADPDAPTSIDPGASERVSALPGVLAASRYADLSGRAPTISSSRADGTEVLGQVPLYAGDAAYLDSIDASVTGRDLSTVPTDLPVAVIGRELADRIGLQPEELGTRIVRIGAAPVTVVGVVEDSPRLRAAQRGIVLPFDAGVLPEDAQAPTSMVVKTRSGAAAAVADVLAAAGDPYHPTSLQVSRLLEGSELREDVDVLLVRLGWGASVLAALVGAIVVSAHAAGSVAARAGEIGLRRSLGARRHDIVAQFLMESVVIGTFAAAVGTAIGTASVVVFSAVNGWVPVVDPVALVLAPVVALVTAAVAGAVPALRASRVDPALALRS